MTIDDVKDFSVKSFGEYLKSTKEKLNSKLCEEQNIRKVTQLLYIFLATSNEVEKYASKIQSDSSDNCVYHYNIEILNLVDPYLYMINT